MFGIVSRVRSFLSFGTDDVTSSDEDWDDYTYEAEDDAVEEEVEEDDTDIDVSIEPIPDHVIEVESVSDIKGIGSTRASELDSAGFATPADVYFADDEELAEVDGIGPYTVDQIREDIGSPEE